jgi:tRNA(fMet)-specific endonuclease VapC
LSEFLVDTDWTADFLNGRPAARDLISSFGRDGFAISILTYAELFEGVADLPSGDRRRADLDDLAQNTDLVGVDDETARGFGTLRSRLRAQGQLIGDMALLIAAAALRNDMTLVSRDRHFERISGLRLRNV